MKMNNNKNNTKDQFYNRKKLLEEFGNFIIPVCITCGTYSSALCSWIFPLNREKNIEKDESEENLFPVVCSRDYHTGSINQICTSGKLLYSSGSDEKIYFFDMNENKSLGIIQNYQKGNISCFKLFGDNNYVFIGTTTGEVCLFSHYKNLGYKLIWQKEHLKKNEINNILLPKLRKNQKFFISTDIKGLLCLWNLITGKKEHEVKFTHKIDLIEFFGENDNYLILIQRKSISCFFLNYKTGKLNTMFKIVHDCIITSLKTFDDNSFIIGDQKGVIRIINIIKENEEFNISVIQEIKNIHLGRIKQIEVFEINILEYLISVISDDGIITIWRFLQQEEIIKLQVKKNVGLRFLSLGVNFIKTNISKVIKNDYYRYGKILEKQNNENIINNQKGEDKMDLDS